MLDKKEQGGYRKWVALAAAFLIMAGPYSIINTIHSLFIHPVVHEYGFSLKSFSFLFTLSAIVIALASPLVGRAIGAEGPWWAGPSAPGGCGL